MTATGDRSGETIRIGSALVTLGKRVKSGGAGSVYLLPQQPQSVAKLYHTQAIRDRYQDKLDAMLALVPDLPVREEHGQRYVQIAWPTALVRDQGGHFLGFAMPLLDIAATSELEPILQERQARAAGLPTGLGPKLTLAANLAAVVAALHRQKHYVIDLKPVNLRFYRKALYIAILDCDGFSIGGRQQRYDADQVTADYLAPEFQAGGIPHGGELAQDLFALATIIFQLLNFGIHPFSGIPASDRVPTDIPSRIRGGYYAYGQQPHPQIAPNPASGHRQLPDELRALFDQAFASRQRPDADRWATLLTRYASRDSGLLVVCANDASHQHFARLACAACARQRLLTQARNDAPAHRKQRIQDRQHVRARVVARTSAIHGATVQGKSSGLAGCLWTLTCLIVGGLIMMHSCSTNHEPTPAPVAYNTTNSEALQDARDAANAAADAARAAGALDAIVPVADQPDTAPVLIVLNAALQGSAPAFGSAMAMLKTKAATYPHAQAASLQAYFAELAKRPDPTEQAFQASNDAYRRIVEADPYASFAAIELGQRLLLSSQPDQARAMFMLAALVHPESSKPWYALGISYLGKDDRLATASIAIADVNAGHDAQQDATSAAFNFMAMRDPDSSKHLQIVQTTAAELAAALRKAPASP